MSDSQFSGYWLFYVFAWSVYKQFAVVAAFMLGVVKMLLKEEVEGSALNSHGNITLLIIENHGKIMEMCF